MADKLRLQPVELTRMAGSLLTGSQQVGDGMRGAVVSSFQPPAGAFGTSAAAAALSATVQSLCEDTTLVVERLVGVLEGDVDRIYQAAFALQQQDDANALRMRIPDPTGGPQAW